MNAWGAYNLGILEGLGVENAFVVFLQAIVLNFYAIAAVVLVLLVILLGIDVGPMSKAEERTRGGELLWPEATPMIDEDVLSPDPVETIEPKAMNMIAPIAAMVLFMPVALYITGAEAVAAAGIDATLVNILGEGSGSTSVLWSVLFGLAVAWTMLLAQRGVHDRRAREGGTEGRGCPRTAGVDPVARPRLG